jgi:hypothetical protein
MAGHTIHSKPGTNCDARFTLFVGRGRGAFCESIPRQSHRALQERYRDMFDAEESKFG